MQGDLVVRRRASYDGRAPHPIRQAALAERLATLRTDTRTVRFGMEGITFTVTLVRPGPWPSVEVAAYEYTGLSLPSVGDTVNVRKVGGDEERRGYVTRVVASAMTPISVTEIAPELSQNETIQTLP